MTPEQDQSELLLTAFRYVSGELPAGEATLFEVRMADDQSARDALTDVVELSEAVAVEEFERCRPLRTVAASVQPRHVAPKWGVVAVCVVAVATLFVLNKVRTDPIGRPEDAAPVAETTIPVENDADAVLSLWSELGRDNADLTSSETFPGDDPDALSPNAGEVPDWMLAAVVGDGHKTSSDRMPEDMRELMDDPDHENL
jgi:hypothetical protein